MYYRLGTGVRCCTGVRQGHFVFSHQVAALLCRGRHLESVTSNRKSDYVNWYVFNWGTFLPSSKWLYKWSFTDYTHTPVLFNETWQTQASTV